MRCTFAVAYPGQKLAPLFSGLLASSKALRGPSPPSLMAVLICEFLRFQGRFWNGRPALVGHIEHHMEALLPDGGHGLDLQASVGRWFRAGL